ncbi:ECM1 Shuttling pre-60S factor ECM1 [Candida maltosa Xu316]
MAKKVSKHSRAARRGLIDAEGSGEAKSLESLPRENSEVKKSIIRTTIKNENLLTKKMELSKVKKASSKKKTSALKHKLERSSKVSGILATKIDQSIQRAKYVQNARKSGWDKTNQSIKIENHLAEELRNAVKEKELTQEEIDKMEEDEYVKDFYAKDEPKEEQEQEEEKTSSLGSNRFALLDDVEA